MKNIQFNLHAKMEIGVVYTKISVESVCLHVADHFFFSILWLGIHNLFSSSLLL